MAINLKTHLSLRGPYFVSSPNALVGDQPLRLIPAKSDAGMTIQSSSPPKIVGGDRPLRLIPAFAGMTDVNFAGMTAITHNRRGFTLIELMIASSLLSVILLGVSSIFVHANRFFSNSQVNIAQADTYIALEHMARHIALANSVEVTNAAGVVQLLPNPGVHPGVQLKMSWDYNAAEVLNGGTGTGDNLADDTWVKYSFSVAGNPNARLFWIGGQAAEAGSTPTGAADQQVQPGLVVVSANATPSPTDSSFAMVNNNTVRITLVTNAGNNAATGNPARTITITRDVTAHAMSS